MPLRRYGRRYTRKAPGRRRRFTRSRRRYRRYNKRGSRGKYGMIRMTGPNPVPRRAIVRMKWLDLRQVNVTGHGTDSGFAINYNMNDINTPLSTSTFQPYSHDTYDSLFVNFRVIACKYNIAVTPIDGANALKASFRCEQTALGTVTDMSAAGMAPGSITKIAGGLGGFGGNRLTFKGTCLPRVVMGLTSLQYKTSDETFGVLGTVGAGAPVNTCIGNLQLGCQSTCDVQVKATLIYYVELYDPQLLSVS